MRKFGLIGGLATLVASQALVLTPSAEAMTIATLEASRLVNSGVLAQTLEPQADVKIDAAVLDSFARGSRPDVLVNFQGKADLSYAYTVRGHAARASFVHNTLSSFASVVQAEARSQLQSFGRQESNLNDPNGFMTLWLTNSIAVKGLSQAELEALSMTPGVRSILVQEVIAPPIDEEIQPELVPPVVPMAVEGSIAKINAPDVWALGYRGAGITISNTDSGVRHTHAALVNQYRGTTGPGTFNHNYNWFDPYNFSATPRNSGSHGTHVMGTMVGNDGGANEIGVAPEADWIACIGFGGAGGSATNAGLIACGQFDIAPTNTGGTVPNPALAAHAVNNSWGNTLCNGAYNNWYEGVVDGWVAAGIVPVFSMGNASNCGLPNNPPLGQNSSPSNYGKIISVGSTGNTNGQYAGHSIKGPTVNPSLGLPTYPDHKGFPNLKPNIVAPGVNIRSSITTSDTAYGGSTGTSMSSPAVTGLIALMWNAAPCLIGDYPTTGTILMETATRIPVATGSPSDGPGSIPNQATGWGEVDALAAVTAAIAECGGTGTDPSISVSPTALDLTVEEGDSESAPVAINNIGGGTLNWTVNFAATSCATPGAVSWLSAAPTSGATVPATPGSTTVTVNASALAPGDYSAFVCINSNATNTPQLSIPVSVTVTEEGALPFPQPYCDVTVDNDVEPISRVIFGDIDNPSNPAINGSPALENFLAVSTPLTAGSTVEMRVEGHTGGDFLTHVRAFFDWNRDGDLTDAGESFAIGTIDNSNGADGVQAIGNVAVPAGVTSGPVRMRVVKQFNASPTNPCTSTWGQAEDYTVVFGGGGGGTDPEITVAPTSLDFTVAVGGADSDDLSITNSGGGTLTWEIETAAVAASAQGADTVVRGQRGTGGRSSSLSDSATAGSYVARPGARGSDVLVDQQPNGVNGLFSEPNCAICTTGSQSMTESFVLSAAASVDQIVMWGGYFSGNVAFVPDTFTVLVYQDAGGIPGAVISQQTNVPSARVQTGAVLFGVNEWEYTLSLSTPVALTAGTYWVEIFNTNAAAADDFFWETGDQDPVAGQAGSLFSTDGNPGVTWNPTTDNHSLAMQIISGGGGPGPVGCDNPSTIPWLDVGTTTGSAAAGETDLSAISVDATGLAAGSYDALLCVTSNDTAGNELVEVPVSLTVSGGGGGDVEYSVNPTSLTASQAAGTTTSQTLTLTNNGTQTGTYSIVESAAGGRPGKPALLGGPTELYSNGPFITNAGGGAGGADASVLESTILSTYGFGAQQSAGNRVADEFTVPASGWTVDEMTFYTYQTGSTTTSTITGITVRIWDGVPGEAGSNVVFGDETTNVMTSTSWSNVYRSIDTNVLDSTRPIMEVVADIGGLALAGGTYWVDYQFNGTLGSGPWAVPITILGQTVTGNGLQSLAGVWGPAVDTNFGHQAGFPFVVTGTGEGGGGTCSPSDAPWLSVSPTSGSTPAGGSSPVTVSFNSTGLTAGVYNATLCVLSNDSVGNEEIEVPVSLTVTGGGGPFPAPYCPVTVTNDIEPITRVIIGDINNTSSPVVDGSPALEDFLSVQTELTAGSTVEMRVESNTAGDFTHHIRAFFDWNNDGDLTDAGESYVIGTIDNSTGVDGQQAIANVVVPATATNGPVRMRVTAQFNASLTNPCGPISWGQAEDYTVNVTGGGGGGDPIIDVAPEALSLTADVGASDSDDLSITNVGLGTLTWSIDEAEPARELIEIAGRKMNGSLMAELGTTGGSSFQSVTGPVVPQGGTQMSQTTNTNIAPANSVACPSGENRALRRFYFNEHPGVANPASITSIDVAIQEASTTTSLTVNLYTLPASTPVDTIPVGSLTQIGTATVAISPADDGTIINVPVTGNVADTSVSNLVVEVASAGNWFIGASDGGQTHPGFLVASGCGATTPTPIHTLGPDFVDTHIIMVVNTGAGGPPQECDAPSSIPWLSAAPASGSAAAGETDLSTITANATGLTAGTYDALLCVNSNDATNPTVVVPVEFTVEAGVDDGIFCDGFELGGDGSCGGGGPGDPDIVVIDDINFVPNPDFTGGSIQWVDGTTCNCDTTPFNFNVYGDPATLQFFWPLNASGLEGGVTLDATTYAKLGSGATIDSSSQFLVVTASAATSPWTTAGTGYLGFKFDNGGTVNYGYAEITTGAGGRPFTIVSIAYNSAGDPITIP